MRLICPSCGAIASAEAWANDPACRQTLDLLMKLPPAVASRTLPYLGLFRQGLRGLTWSRALKLVEELAAMVGAATLAWDGKEPRVVSPDAWARAIDSVLARRPEALQNHNYLRHAAYETAGRKESRGSPRASDVGSSDSRYPIPASPAVVAPETRTDEEWAAQRKRARELREKHGKTPARLDSLVDKVAGKMEAPK